MARCVLEVRDQTEATMQVGWDDALLLRVNGAVFELGSQDASRARRRRYGCGRVRTLWR
ncbi:MAG: hypothetical protein OXF55_01710 [Caldilineaceae bacterium]|nr:hypothetical protein [Caldilineaceae bacterium]MDE0181994.1 hypothetical protein [Caldilineaceae bacterium]